MVCSLPHRYTRFDIHSTISYCATRMILQSYEPGYIKHNRTKPLLAPEAALRTWSGTLPSHKKKLRRTILFRIKNMYALSVRHSGPCTSAMEKSILKWCDRLRSAKEINPASVYFQADRNTSGLALSLPYNGNKPYYKIELYTSRHLNLPRWNENIVPIRPSSKFCYNKDRA